MQICPQIQKLHSGGSWDGLISLETPKTLCGGSRWKYVISPASGPTTSRRSWIFFLSSNSLHSSTYKCVRVNITHRKVTSSTAHAPDLQPVVFCIQPESLFSFLEKEDLHVTQSILQLHNLPLTLPYVPLQLMLKGDGVRTGRASRR